MSVCVCPAAIIASRGELVLTVLGMPSVLTMPTDPRPRTKQRPSGRDRSPATRLPAARIAARFTLESFSLLDAYAGPRSRLRVTEFTARRAQPNADSFMPYTRQNPSARYRALVDMYRELHRDGEKSLGIPAASTFEGLSLHKESPYIKRLIERSAALSILDYGSGKGRQYDPKPHVVEGEGTWDSVIDYWGVDEVTCFDPAYEPYSKLPSGTFGGVICTDVLEHCPEEDIAWILREIFSYAERFVFLSIACFPARKCLPNGENAHCTIRPTAWWQGMIERAAAERPGVIWEAWLEAELGSTERETVCLQSSEPLPAR